MATLNDVAPSPVRRARRSRTSRTARYLQLDDGVLRAVESAAYSPDVIARSLVRSKTDSIGLVVPDTSQLGFAGMVRGVEHVARSAEQHDPAGEFGR